MPSLGFLILFGYCGTFCLFIILQLFGIYLPELVMLQGLFVAATAALMVGTSGLFILGALGLIMFAGGVYLTVRKYQHKV